MLQLAFANGESSLTVRSFSVDEGLSSLFTVSLVALSEDDNLDLSGLAGAPASLTFAGGPGERRGRCWAGVCTRSAQLHAEPNGASTYQIVIGPSMWLMKKRRNNRIFAHRSLVDIVQLVLGEHGLEPELDLEEPHEVHEYRVQYGESDLAFVSRLLEEEGMSYFFRHGSESSLSPSRLVLADRPDRRPSRGALRFVAEPPDGGQSEYATAVSEHRSLAPGAHVRRDYGFSHPSHGLVARASAEGVEATLEQYHYDPAAFIKERGGAPRQVSGPETDRVSAMALAASRGDAETLSLSTNAVDVGPGEVVELSEHKRERVNARPWLVRASRWSGQADGTYAVRATCAPATTAFRPPRLTPKPRILGVQSAIVVSPGDEEIHTDEHGRVRVQFHWDREGTFDERSSCWIRVSQGWAGGAWGGVVLPRVGQEVMVDFLDGDPDRPIVVGRLYNRTNPAPARLPEEASQSVWRSQSSPGGRGMSQIVLDDRAGAEALWVRAERDLRRDVEGDEQTRVEGDELVVVGDNRACTVGERHSTLVGRSLTLASADVGELHIVEQGKPEARPRATSLGLTEGGVASRTDAASLLLSRASVAVHADGLLQLAAGRDVTINGARVLINEREAKPGLRSRGGRVLGAVGEVFGAESGTVKGAMQ